MKEQHFDQITRVLAGGVSRRGALKRLLGFLFGAGIITSGCDQLAGAPAPPEGGEPDCDMTAESIAAARDALAAGATEVRLSVDDCAVYRRTLSADGRITQEEFTFDGHVSGLWEHDDTESRGLEDLDLDGFFEWRAHVVAGAGEDDEAATVEYHSPATQAVVRRETYRREGDIVHCVWEEDDGTGSLVTVNEFETGIWSHQAAGTRAARDGLSTETIGLASGCSAEQSELLKRRLFEAHTAGFRCLWRNGARTRALRLHGSSIIRRVRLRCASLEPDEHGHQPRARVSWLRYLPFTRADITVDYSFFDLSSDQQRNVLLHELLHIAYGPHEGGVENHSRFREIDEMYACAALCFESESPGSETRCACARCLETTVDDPRCQDFDECDPDMGGYCDCDGSRWDSCTDCHRNSPCWVGHPTCRIPCECYDVSP